MTLHIRYMVIPQEMDFGRDRSPGSGRRLVGLSAGEALDQPKGQRASAVCFDPRPSAALYRTVGR